MSQHILENSVLPAPAERPGSDVIIFDGICSFCGAQVRRFHRWDRYERLSFISLHDPAVKERWPDLTQEQLMNGMYVVTSDGQRFGGAAAFRYLSRRLPRLWPLMPIMHIPFSLPIWQRLYRWIAARRYQLGQSGACEDDACRIHFD